MKKNCTVNFAQVTDTTGYLFSFAKSLSAALQCGGYEAYAQDVIAASGFAFRTWAAKDLCPSAMSIWEFKKQKPWTENAGLSCDYVERLWGEDAIEEERRTAAIHIIQKSVDQGMAAIAWDISGCEWGLVTGYDEEEKNLHTLKINGCEDSISYEQLGKLELPLLSVLTVTGKTEKSAAQLVADTKALAASHLQGEEWCDNAQGLAAYDTIIAFIQEQLSLDTAWNLEYYLGTYAALRWYAWKFFEKYKEKALAVLYKDVHLAWQEAFEQNRSRTAYDETFRAQLIALLRRAQAAEKTARELLK